MVAMILSLVFVIYIFVGLISNYKKSLKNDVWKEMGFKD